MTKKLKVEVGSIVAFNTLDDATWFEVLEKDGDNIVVRQEWTVNGAKYSPQNFYASLVKQVRKP